MSKHSPGPWTYIDAWTRTLGQMFSKTNVTVFDRDNSAIAEVYGENLRRQYDARLIAAAPELYELVRRLGFGAYATASSRAGMEARALLACIDGDENGR